MSDPFLSSSSELSSSQSSAELSSQSSVQSLFKSVFYEVTDSSNSQVSQVSSPSDLSFPLDNHDYILLDIVLPAPAPHTHIQESDLPAILTESRLEIRQTCGSKARFRDATISADKECVGEYWRCWRCGPDVGPSPVDQNKMKSIKNAGLKFMAECLQSYRKKLKM